MDFWSVYPCCGHGEGPRKIKTESQELTPCPRFCAGISRAADSRLQVTPRLGVARRNRCIEVPIIAGPMYRWIDEPMYRSIGGIDPSGHRGIGDGTSEGVARLPPQSAMNQN